MEKGFLSRGLNITKHTMKKFLFAIPTKTNEIYNTPAYVLYRGDCPFNNHHYPAPTMTWNYRIFRHEHKLKSIGWNSEWFGLHEVYYNEDGLPETYAIEPEVIGDNIEDLIASISLMLKDAKAHQKAKKEGKRNYQQKGKKKSKIILEPKDFEEGGIYFVNLQAMEKEFEDIISTATINEKRDSKNTRRKQSSRNKPPRK